MEKQRHEYLINPTLACGNRLNLKEDLDTLVKLGNRIVHIDVMDGNYVPNLCFDLDTIRQIKEQYPFVMDVHLMVLNPQDYIEKLAKIGVEYVSFHLGSVDTPIRIINAIREKCMKAGIVLNPYQRPEDLEYILPFIDYVVVMGVEPGFSGQTFLETTYEKIEKLSKMREKAKLQFLIEVDGGIHSENGKHCIKNGADILVAGAFAVFQGNLEKDYKKFELDLQETV